MHQPHKPVAASAKKPVPHPWTFQLPAVSETTTYPGAEGEDDFVFKTGGLKRGQMGRGSDGGSVEDSAARALARSQARKQREAVTGDPITGAVPKAVLSSSHR